MEKIVSICELENVEDPRQNSEEGYCYRLLYDGYEIATTEHVYYLLIENEQNCCENWGYFSSNNDLDQYIGKELTEVRMTDVALNVKAVEESGYYEDEGGIQFVDFLFSDGDKVQFAVYNSHNGYYGHSIYYLIDGKVEYEDVL